MSPSPFTAPVSVDIRDTLPGALIVPGARPLRVFAYSRYSSHLQDDGWSIPAQHTAHEHEAAARRGAGVAVEVVWYDEPAESAHVERIDRRPVFARLLQEATAGGCDMVWVHKMDRFSRRLSVTTEALQRLHAAGVGFLSLAERFDLTTPAGWLTANLFAALADFYSRNLGAEIKKGKQARAASGLHTCRVPFGYRLVARAGDGAISRLAAEPDVSDGRRDAAGRELGAWTGLHYLFGLLLDGLTDQEAATRMNTDGRWRLATPSRARDATTDVLLTARLFTRQSVAAIRHNVYYRPYQPGDTQGTVRDSEGVAYRGQHVAACTWDEWQTMQELARGRRRGWTTYARQRAQHPRPGHSEAGGGEREERAAPVVASGAEFRALAACSGCGGRLYVWRRTHTTKAGARRVYESYVCVAADRNITCPQNRHHATVEDVRALWLRWMEQHLSLPATWEAQVRAYAARLTQAGVQDGGEGLDAAQVQAALRRWEMLRERAIETYAEGLRDKAWRDARLEECEREVARLRAAQRGPEHHQAHLLETGRQLINLPAWWPRMTPAERVAVASKLIEPQGLVLDLHEQGARYTRWHPRPPSGVLADAALGGRLVAVRLRAPVREILRVLAEG